MIQLPDFIMDISFVYFGFLEASFSVRSCCNPLLLSSRFSIFSMIEFWRFYTCGWTSMHSPIILIILKIRVASGIIWFPDLIQFTLELFVIRMSFSLLFLLFLHLILLVLLLQFLLHIIAHIDIALGWTASTCTSPFIICLVVHAFSNPRGSNCLLLILLLWMLLLLLLFTTTTSPIITVLVMLIFLVYFVTFLILIWVSISIEGLA